MLHVLSHNFGSFYARGLKSGIILIQLFVLSSPWVIPWGGTKGQMYTKSNLDTFNARKLTFGMPLTRRPGCLWVMTWDGARGQNI